MKEINELIFPNDARYSADHEWVMVTGENIKIGINDYAQDQLGAIVFVELPEIGSHIDKGEEFGVVESTKAVAELFMPISGEILSVNEELEDSPELINQSPYDDGWIIEIRQDDPAQMDELMTRDDYINMLRGM